LSWNDVVRPSTALAAMMILGLSGAAMAETLVVRSAGPSAKSYPPGRAIPDAASIVLKANDQVVVLDGRGTRTLRGPGTFSPVAASGSGTDTRSTLSSLVAQRSDRRARIGAVRSMSAGPARSPNIWFVDVDRSTTVCVADPTAVTMWRAGVPKPATVTVTSQPAGKNETMAWPKDAPTAPWPSSMPIANGAQYSITMPGTAQPTSVRFVVLGPAVKGLEDLASMLIKNNCTAQLDLLIETVAIPEPTAAAGG
jgi:hypothetical protein